MNNTDSKTIKAPKVRKIKEMKDIKDTKKSSQNKDKNISLAIKPSTKARLAVILVRGLVRVRGDILASLFTLKLRKKHVCVVVDNTPSIQGTVMKCKDYITYGELNDETYELLVEKRGRKDSEGKIQNFFALHPPRGGFERKGIKTPFTSKGALGYRGEKINDLIKRMI